MCRWRATCSRLRTQALSSGSGPHVRQIDERSADLAIGIAHKILDLSCVTLVDVEVVRFLIRGDEEGIEIAHSLAYVREWMQRERAEGGQVGSSDPA